MASEIRVNKIENRSGLGTVTFADTGVDLAGIVTATTFSGSGASLTGLPAAQVTGTLPAISGANLTNLAAANLTGTIADARFPATLPAASAANLTSIPAANVTGTLPALTAANLTNIPAANLVGVCTSGLTRTGGFGKYIQTKQLINTSTQLLQSQSYTDVTGFSTSITPTSASNFLIVSSTINAGSTGSGGYILQRKIGSGSYSNLSTIIGADDGSRLECTINVGQTGDSTTHEYSYTFVDYPNTTDEVFYKWQMGTPYHSTYKITHNRSMTDSDSNYYPRTASTMIISEVAG